MSPYEFEHRLVRIEEKLDRLTEAVARITGICPIMQERVTALEKEIYGNGSPGLKEKVTFWWLLGAAIGGGVITAFGQWVLGAVWPH